MKKIWVALTILLFVWIAHSCIEVVCKDLSDTNLFVILADERVSYGTYYDDGTVETIDGHIWGCRADMFTDGTPIKVYFDDNGTDDVTDDEITRIREYK